VYAITLGALVEWPLRSIESLLQAADEGMALAENAYPQFHTLLLLIRAWCQCELGGNEDGFAVLNRGEDLIRATGGHVFRPFFLFAHADAEMKIGQSEKAFDILTRAIESIEATNVRWMESEVHRVRGEIFCSRGDADAGDESLALALTVARQQGAKIWELNAAASLAQMWGKRGRRAEAVALLAPVYDWFTEGLDTKPLIEAKEVLDGLR
jgi:predicted ATPase